MDKGKIEQLYRNIHLDEEKDKEEIEGNLKENMVALFILMDKLEEDLCYKMRERVKEVKQYITNLEADSLYLKNMQQVIMKRLERYEKEQKEVLDQIKNNIDGFENSYLIERLKNIKQRIQELENLVADVGDVNDEK